jgi:hypothetical protein
MNEFSGIRVNGNGCSYANLCSYNTAYLRGVMPPIPSNAAGRMGFIIPNYGLPGYRSLTHGVGPSCNNYFSVNQAYGPLSNCGRYTTALCSSPCGQYNACINTNSRCNSC